MQSFGLALTLLLLTSSFIAIDLTDVKPEPTRQHTSRASSMNDGSNTLAIMPSSVPGVVIPNADLRNGVFALGSSTDNAGLDEEGHEVNYEDNDSDDTTDSPTIRADKANDFVLI